MSKKHSNAWQKKLYDKAFASTTLATPEFAKEAEMQISVLFEKLNLSAKSAILDVPCGVGRHSLAMAKRGHKITALDISHDCLKIARKNFDHKNINYKPGNMIDLKKYRSKFDLLTNLFTSFGYFATDQENEKVLREMKRALKPGGQIAMSLMDRDWLKKIFNGLRWTENKKGIVHIEKTSADWKTGYITTEWIILKRGPEELMQIHYHKHRIKIYKKSELIKLFNKVGFKKIRVFDGFNNKKYKAGVSHHPLYIAEA
jgi:2-polyprenyl-3-methyl-5-hydroxy-6-metoxy-1,4-benzoquinol methylase